MSKFLVLLIAVASLCSARAFASATSVADVPAPVPGQGSPTAPSLDERVSRLESALFDAQNRLTALERGGALPNSWSCSAQCGGFYSGELRYRVVSSAASAAGTAFANLQSSCESSAFLFNGTEQYGSERRLIPASIQNSCVRN